MIETIIGLTGLGVGFFIGVLWQRWSAHRRIEKSMRYAEDKIEQAHKQGPRRTMWSN